MYDNMRDVEFRLRGTLVEYKGQLKYVNGCDMIGRAYVIDLRGIGNVRLDSRHLKITNIRTGYMNIDGHLVYLSRRPTRAYRQGLRQDNTSCTGDICFRELMDRVRLGLNNTELRDGCKILSSDYAVIEDQLYYRTRLVGIYHNNKPYLNNDKKFLVESLTESLGEHHA
jgi:hypothetical protein